MKNLLEILTGASVEVTTLKALLTQIAEGDSDAAPVAADLLAKLEAVDVDLGGLAVAVPREVFDVFRGKFDSRFHPGGAA